jgi:hypothetical protein
MRHVDAKLNVRDFDNRQLVTYKARCDKDFPYPFMIDSVSLFGIATPSVGIVATIFLTASLPVFVTSIPKCRTSRYSLAVNEPPSLDHYGCTLLAWHIRGRASSSLWRFHCAREVLLNPRQHIKRNGNVGRELETERPMPAERKPFNQAGCRVVHPRKDFSELLMLLRGMLVYTNKAAEMLKADH